MLALPLSFAFSGAGSGISGDPYQITDCDELQEMNNGLSSYYQLQNDIDCSDTINWNSGAGFIPIGANSPYFSGNFNGQNYTISSLYVFRTSNYAGLFGRATSGAVLEDVKLSNITVTGTNYVGGLAGYIYTTSYVNNTGVENGTITASTGSAGGLVGYSYSSYVHNSYSKADVIGTGAADRIGGLIGTAYAKEIVWSYATGSVSGDDRVGGLVGEPSNVNIYDSYATGNVSGTSYVGGLTGINPVSYNTYSTGYVTNTNYLSGGYSGLAATSGNSNNYWDTYTSGFAVTPGSYATGKNTSEMRNLVTYSGWDFSNVWDINISLNKGYPYLRNLVDSYDIIPVTTEFVTNYTSTSAILRGTLRIENRNVSFQYRVKGGSTWTNTSSSEQSSTGEFTEVLTTLTPRTAYEFRAVVDDGTTYSYGDIYYFSTAFSGGLGTFDQPYQISTVYQLQDMEDLPDCHYILIHDIDATPTNPSKGSYNGTEWPGSGFRPVGTTTDRFRGYFNGSGHDINGLYISRSSDYQALFAVAGMGATFRNFTMTDVSITANQYAAGMVGVLYGATNPNDEGIFNVRVTGNVTGTQYVGLLASYVSHDNNVTYISTEGIVTSTGLYAGGAIGRLYNGYLSYSYSKANVTSTTSYVGGLVGSTYARQVTNSYASGNVVGDQRVGGLLGESSSSTIIDSYATGNVTGGTYIGGLVGLGGIFYNTYATGYITETSAQSGGLVGSGPTGGNANNYWNTYTSAKAASPGSYATGKNTTEMRNLVTYSGWDFSGTWDIDTSLNKGFPYLRDLIDSYDIIPVTTELVTNYTSTSATLRGTLRVSNRNVSFQYRAFGSSTWTNTTRTEQASTGEFTEVLTTLTPRTTYEFRAVVDDGTTYNYGDINKFSISFSGGFGTVTEPYQIETIYQLQDMEDLPDRHYILIDDIDATATNPSKGNYNGTEWPGSGFRPIGTTTNRFRGYFDGSGHDINGLYISRSSDYQGIFGAAGMGAIFRNFTITDASVTGNQYTGSLIGILYGASSDASEGIFNVGVTGNLTGTTNVGLLAGYTSSDNNISSSYAIGQLSTTGGYAGGLAGRIYNTYVLQSYAKVNVTGTASTDRVGGLLGSAYAREVRESFSTGSVYGNQRVGGLLGESSSSSIYNSYSTGNVTGSRYVGGMCGIGGYSYWSYATGYVTGGLDTGGFIGAGPSNSVGTPESFWDTESSGQATSTDPYGEITGKTTSEMKTQSTFTDASWDFTNAWAMDTNNVTNLGYPYFQWYVNTNADAPSLTISSPQNQSYLNYTNVSFIATVTEDIALQNYTLTIWDSTNSTVTSSSWNITGTSGTLNQSYVLSEGNYTWNYYICDNTGNCVEQNTSITIDLTIPQVDFSANNPVNDTGSSGSFTLNTTISEAYLRNITYYFNGTYTKFRYNGTNVTNLTSIGSGITDASWSIDDDGSDYYFTLIQTNLQAAGQYEYYINVTDESGNINQTETRIIKGNTDPEVTNISHDPSSEALLDVGTTVNISVIVTDNEGNPDTVILQWKNNSDPWSNAINVTMTNTSYGVTSNYYATIVPQTEGIHTYRMIVNDTIDGSSTSNETNLSIFWDCTWDVTPSSIGTFFGWGTTEDTGNITLMNTGDSQFTNDNCTLDLAVTHNLGSSRVLIDGNQKPEFYEVPAGTNTTIDLTTLFLLEKIQDDLVMTITDLGAMSSNSSNTVTGTLISTIGGPYLYIDPDTLSYPAYMFMGANRQYQVAAYFVNGVGDGNISNSAYNVSFNWSVPGIFEVASATASSYITSTDPVTWDTNTVNLYYNNVSNSSNIYNNLTLEFNESVLASLTNQTITLNITLMGYNLSGDIVEDANGNTTLTYTVDIPLFCDPVVDGILVEACGQADGDYEEEIIIINNNQEEEDTRGGGGGGAGNGERISITDLSDIQREALFQTSEIYELVRGENQTFILTVENAFSGRMDEVTMELSGFLDQYIDIYPKTHKSIGINDSLNYTVSINAPEYFTDGNYELLFVIRGVINNTKEFGNRTLYRYSPIQEQRTIELYIVPISRSDAEDLIKNSSFLLSELQRFGYNTIKLEPLMQMLDQFFDERDYSEIIDTEALMQENYNDALESDSLLAEVRNSISDANDRGLKTAETDRLVLLAQAALDRGEFELALKRANDAKFYLALEVVGKFNVWNFIQRNWHLLLLSFIALLCIMFIFAISMRYFLLQEKLKVLHKESHIVLGLIKESQIECFEKGKLSMEEYMETITEYETRLNKIVQAIITNETTLANLTKILGNEEKRLVDEKERILKLMRETQVDYIDTKKLETRAYENRMRTYQERLAEIEEKLITMEADRAMRHSHKKLANPLFMMLSLNKKPRSFFKKANPLQKTKEYFIDLGKDIVKSSSNAWSKIATSTTKVVDTAKLSFKGIGTLKTNFKKVEAKKIETPKIKSIKLKLPKLKLPKMIIPKFKLGFKLPKMTLPKVNIPKVSVASAEVKAKPSKSAKTKPMSHREEMLHGLKKAYKKR
ncbi:hypothetical protein H6503_05920 [Candidatus Woesearchaeota archaeon]|nr:hypothetical protein [Candidatus Woesearchaeota archaeon]